MWGHIDAKMQFCATLGTWSASRSRRAAPRFRLQPLIDLTRNRSEIKVSISHCKCIFLPMHNVAHTLSENRWDHHRAYGAAAAGRHALPVASAPGVLVWARVFE